jgi:hypothetical protein
MLIGELSQHAAGGEPAWRGVYRPSSREAGLLLRLLQPGDWRS